MGKRDDVKWNDRLHALGMRGRLPAVLTPKVLDAARAHRGERFTLPDGTVAGLYLQVGETGHSAFYLAFRSPASGKRTNMKIAAVESPDEATLAVARSKAVQARGLLGEDQDPAQVERERQGEAQTVGAYLRAVYAPQILAHQKDGGCPKEQGAKATGTYARVETAWKPFLDVPLSSLTGELIEERLAARKLAGKTAGTLRRDWSALRALLSNAVRRKCLTAVPLAGLPEPLRKMVPNSRVRYLGQHDPEEPERFRKALAAWTSSTPDAGEFLRCVAGLALATGMRRGEIVQLTDKMVNERERRIDLPAEITKTNKARKVYLSDEALSVLMRWNVRGTGGELFPGEPRYWLQRLTEREWPAFCAQAKVEDFHFHDCRHDFAVRLLRSCRDLYKVRDALGHASVTQTEKYAHVIESDVREAVLSAGQRVS